MQKLTNKDVKVDDHSITSMYLGGGGVIIIDLFGEE